MATETSREAIAEAGLATLKRTGLTAWTVDQVSDFAHCAKGLVLYHFGTKAALLEEVAARVRDTSHDARMAALQSQGTAAIDRLWDLLLRETGDGTLALRLALAAHLESRPHVAPTPAQLRALDRAAGVSLALPPGTSGLPIPPLLDAMGLALLQGTPPAAAREWYDRIWLALLT